jgi:hypothetical protein
VSRSQVHGLDGVELGEVVGVLDGHGERALFLLEGRAHVLLQEFRGQPLLDVGRDRAPGQVRERRVEELREGAADLLLGDLVVLDQDLGDVELVDARIADRVLQVLLGDEPLVHEQAVLRRLVAAGGAMLVVESDAQDLGELLGRLLVLGREGPAAALVDELQDAQQVLLEQDRRGQDLAGAEVARLVPARVELEVRMKAGELAGIVGVLDVRGLAAQGREAGDGPEGLGDADLLDLGAGLDQREQLLVLGVEGEDRDALGLHEVRHLVLDVDEDVLDAAGRVDGVGDLDQPLSVRELLLRPVRGCPRGHKYLPPIGKTARSRVRIRPAAG